jgi:hypothetical protein
LEADNPFEYFLQYTAWAIRSTYHTTLQSTPCQLVFGRDMIHNCAFKENWDQIQKRKKDIINKSNRKENKIQNTYEYTYSVTQVYNNGTVQIQRELYLSK